MESVETYHAEHMVLPLKLASYEELRYTHNVVEFTELPRPKHGLFHPHLRLLWIEGYDLIQNDLVWVPYELVYLDYTLPLPPGSGCFVATSNGLASGNHVLEAISHGICELVERDASTLWSLRSEEARRRTRLDLDTVDDPSCREVLEKCVRAGVDVAVWEATTDLGIPTFLCWLGHLSVSPLWPLHSASGFGCHPSRGIALLRALTEAAQSRLTMIAGSRDDLLRRDYEYDVCHRTLRQDPADLEIQAPVCRFQNAPTWESSTLNGDVEWELERLQAAGISRVIVFDLTKPEFGLPVVRIVIPRLEPKEPPYGYIPGRRARAVLANPS